MGIFWQEINNSWSLKVDIIKEIYESVRFSQMGLLFGEIVREIILQAKL